MIREFDPFLSVRFSKTQELIKIFILLSISLISNFLSGQVLINDSLGNNISNSSISYCGSNNFSLTSSISPIVGQDSLNWSINKINGLGSLAISSTSSIQPIFTPSSTSLDYYLIQLTHFNLSTGTSSTAQVNVAIVPSPVFPTVPNQFCENDGNVLITNNLGINQSIASSVGSIVSVGNDVFFDPQGLNNNTPVTFTLTETFTVPGTSATFTCSASQSSTVYTAPNVSLNLNASSFQRCSPITNLSGGAPAGGTYSIDGFPNAINSTGQLDPSQLPVGNHTIKYTVTNSNGCSSSTSQIIDITGIILSGPSINLSVGEVTSSTINPILGSTFNGITTYSICSGNATTSFQITPLSGLINFPNYSINWGDNTAVQSGTYSSTAPILHQYNVAGLYTVVLTLSNNNGCSINKTFNLFFGTSQSIGLVTPNGNGTSVCLLPNEDSVYFDFEIVNWQNDPVGISYSFNGNDGKSRNAVSPIVDSGITQYPDFIFYDTVSQKAFYRHYFVGSSCGYTSTIGQTYNNTFSVSATKSTPCPGSQSTSAGGPIKISESPKAIISGPDSVCMHNLTSIYDFSGEGKMIVANGNDFDCDSSASGFWQIYDDQWNLLTLPNNFYSLGSGITLGSNNSFPNFPSLWIPGSNNLSIEFTQKGIFHIVKHIGLTSVGVSVCSIDSDTLTICVADAPIQSVANAIPDTACIGNIFSVLLNSSNGECNSNTLYSFSVFDTLGTSIYSSASTIDTSFSWVASTSGKFILKYGVSNYCGSSFTYDTTYIFDSPNLVFLPNDSVFCGDTMYINLGMNPFKVHSSSIFGNTDSIQYSISPQTGWSLQGLNQNGHDSLMIWEKKAFTITATGYNRCGSETVNTNIFFDSIPNPTFSLDDTSSCSPFQPNVNSFYNNTGTTHIWKILKNNILLETQFGSNPTFNSYVDSLPTNSYQIRHVVVSGNNCKDSSSINFHIIPSPKAEFNISNGACTSWTPTITNNSTGTNMSYQWDIFPKNNLVTLSDTSNLTPNLSFTGLQYPANDQEFILSLLTSSNSGCTSYFSDTISLYARPLAHFTLINDSSCGPHTLIPIENSSTNGTISSWQWNVIDSSSATVILSSTLQYPTFSLPESNSGVATYLIQLIIQDNRGCSDTSITSFYIKPNPTAAFTIIKNACHGSNINNLITNNSNSNDQANNQPTFSWTIDSAGTIFTYNDSVPSHLLINNDTTIAVFIVSLTATNKYGCTSSISDTIFVHPNAITHLDTLNPLSVCAPSTINSNLLGTTHYSGNGTYDWDIKSTNDSILVSYFGRNNLSYTLQNPLDSVWVILEVNSKYGCQPDKDSILVYSVPNPDPYFDLQNDTGCTAFTPILKSLSQNTGYHVWQIFDDQLNPISSALTGINPVFPSLINSNTTGYKIYTLKHTIFDTDSSSCNSSYIRTIYVKPTTVPFVDSISTTCASDSIYLSASSTNNSNISHWTWIISSDTLNGQNVTYFNPIPGVYPINLTITTLEGCDTSVYDSLIISSSPEASIWIDGCGIDTVCLNQVFLFNDSSSTDLYGGNITQYLWDFEDDGIIDYTTSGGTHSFNSTGLKQLRLTVFSEFGCSDDTVINLYVNTTPFNNFEIVDSSICGPALFNITASDTGNIDSSYYELFVNVAGNKSIIQTWDYTPTSLPSLIPNYEGDTTYFMSRTLVNCCGETTVIDSIIIQTPPVANFIILPDTGCTPFNTLLQLDGLIKGGADSAYINFGDGSTLSLKPSQVWQGNGYIYQWGQVPHTFTYTGNLDTNYFVTLSVFNECGDSSLTLPVNVQPNTVQAVFGMDKSNGCVPLTVNFTNYSTNANTTLWCFNWDQSIANCNGGGSIAQNPTWTFTQSGTYTVALFVNNGCGYDTVYQTVTVHPSPNAVISSNNNICANDTVNFVSNSSTSIGWITGYHWDFGNGDTSNLQNVDYLFDTSGTYIVSLVVNNSNGCSDSSQSSIFVRPTPDVSFSTNNICLSDTSFFTNLTTITSGSIIGTSWTFGDGNSSNQFEPYHIYNAPGNYKVNLIHTSDYGCIDSGNVLAIVHDLPQLSFVSRLTSGDSCSIPQTYTFTNNSTNAIQYYWDFDYGNNPGLNTSTLTSPSFTFTSPGSYIVALIAENAFGCMDSIFQNIIIRDGVIANNIVRPLEGCQPVEVSFNDTSVYSSSLDTIQSILWVFGDGFSTVQQLPPFSLTYNYPSYGTFNSYSIVNMASGCIDTSNATLINVFPAPEADFNIDQVNINTRTFQNKTSYVDSNRVYFWTFSNGQSSNEESPTISFEPSTTGLDSIEACLKVINSFGCSDSICKSFWVWPTNLIVPNALAPDLDYIGEDAIFLPKGHSLEEYEIWIYDKWGNEVWYSNKIDPIFKSPSEGWDGKHGVTQVELPMGVYAWKIRAVFDDGTRWTGQNNNYGAQKAFGTLTLIR